MLPSRRMLSDWLSGAARPPIAELLGLKLVQAENGTATMTLAVDRRHHNPIGTVHGGILADLADAAMGTAVATTLSEGETFTTTGLSLHFLEPVREGLLRGRATVVRRGRRLAYAECDILAPDGALLARAQSTCFLARPSG